MEEKNVRATKETIKSEKIVEKSNPVSRGFRRLTNSIAGVGGGCVMLVLGIVFIVLAVKIVPNTSKIVKSLDLLTTNEAENRDNELVKVEGKADISVPAKLEYQIKDDYGLIETHTFNEDAVYFEAEFQIYEQQKETTEETRTVIRDGQEVEQTVEKEEIVEDWVTKKELSSFAVFKLGNIEIDTEGIDTKFDTDETIIENVVIDGTKRPIVYENPSAKVGDTRLIIRYVPAGDDLIVVGNMHNKKIRGGEVFLITNKSDSDLIDSLQSSESMMRWGLRFLAWLFLTMGFMGLVGPLLALTSFIPFVDKIASFITFAFSAIVSLLILISVTLFVKYWFLFLICLVVLGAGLLGLGVYVLRKKK